VPVILFLVVVFAAPWVLRPLLPRPQSVWSALANFAPGVWMPTVAALALIAAFNGISGLRRELRERLRFPHEAGGWLCVAVAAPVIVTEAGVIAARMVGEARRSSP